MEGEPPSLTPTRKANVPSSRHEEIVYQVNVKVMGMAGIAVNRARCREATKKAMSPRSPEQMSAVVTFLYETQTHAVTAPSKNLKRSPALPTSW